MRRGGPQHPKVTLLAAVLGVPRYAAVGLLECLWHWTASYAPHGDVGRFDDVAIALGVGWEGEPAVLIATLERCRFLDVHPTHRLVVHHWNIHADQVTQRFVARSGRNFVGGRKPTRKEASQKLVKNYQKIASGGIGDGVAEHCVKTTGTEQEKASDPTALRPAANRTSKRRTTGIDGFDAFWVAYPRKEKKPRALKAWRALKPPPLLADVLGAIERQRNSAQWLKESGEYIPHPASWLNDRQWEDAPMEDVAKLEAKKQAERIQAMKDQWNREHPEARLRGLS